MRNHCWLVVFVVFGVCPSSCTQPAHRITDGAFTYRLSEPDRHSALDEELDEISGLTYLDAHTLAAIDDEEDAIFLIDTRQGNITERLVFGDRDDYEGLERVEDTWYVLRSDGDVFAIRQAGQPDQSVETYETALSRDHDTEGLGYDAATRTLLIACKEEGGLSSGNDTEKVLVYRYTLGTNQLSPFLYHSASLFRKHLQGRKKFRASAIARHPITQRYYLLSSADQSLVMLDDQNQVLEVVYLDQSRFPQPEGICFSPEGTLYISNEGRKGPATILQFDSD